MNNIFVAGIDIGSTTTKAVIMEGENHIKGTHIMLTGSDMKKAAREVLDIALNKSQLSRENLDFVITTGYGRNTVDWRDESIPEIIATGAGAIYLNKEVRSILDIGGQDCKFILIDDSGNVLDFKMNDICAAGTGRFIEYLTKICQLNLDEIIDKGLCSENPAKIDSTCGVFAGLEIVSKITRKIPIEDIIANDRKSSLYNIGIKLIINPDPQIIGAFGCAILTLKNLKGA